MAIKITGLDEFQRKLERLSRKPLAALIVRILRLREAGELVTRMRVAGWLVAEG